MECFEPTELFSRFETLEGWKKMAATWDRVTGLRNDLAHCGTSREASKVARLEWRAKKLPECLQKFFTANAPPDHGAE